MNISKRYDRDVIVDALNQMLIAHPILGMCVSDEFEVSYLVKGSEPQILVESDVDEEFIHQLILHTVKNWMTVFLENFSPDLLICMTDYADF